MDWDRLDTVELIKHYCRAHTAGALYERLSSDAGVTGVLARCSTRELVDELRARLGEPVSLDRNARAYALLVALALSSPETARKLVLGGDIDALRWGQALVNAADARRRTAPARPSRPDTRGGKI